MIDDITTHGVSAFLRARGMAAPDSRSIHQYSTTDSELESLCWYVREHEQLEWRARDCGAFLLVLAEWGYRNARSARGLIELAARDLALRLHGDSAEHHRRLRVGLQYWRSSAIELDHELWNATLLSEGGFPRSFPRAGLGLLAQEVAMRVPPPELATGTIDVQRMAAILATYQARFPDLAGNRDDVCFLADLFLSFALYRRSLAQHDQLPIKDEAIEHWLGRIRPLAHPNHHLPIRHDLDDVFSEILFPSLTPLGSGVSARPRDGLRSAPSARTRPLDVRPHPPGRAPEPDMTLLNRLRARSQLGRPLYTYRISNADFDELREEVRRDVRNRRHRGSSAARFCLYAAEQLCRAYQGGPWAWRIVLDPAGWHPADGDLRATVQEGLRYWQRPIVATKNQHLLLGTLICEGGLPLNVVAHEHERHIKLFFRALIRHAERHQVSARSFVEEQLPLLPLGFRNDTVAELSWRVADAIVALRACIPDQHAGDPIAYLNSRDAGWHVDLPLRIDDDTLQEFLRGLLAQPPERRQVQSPVEVLTVLHRSAPQRVERRAIVLEDATVAAMSQLLGLSVTSLHAHARMTISLVTVHGERHPVAIARLGDDLASYRLERLPLSPIRHEPSVEERVLISATVGDQEIACGWVPGGEPLLGDVPWVFEGGEPPVAKLLGQGSVRSDSSELWLLVPASVVVSSDRGTVRRVAEATQPLDRDIVSVTGTAICRTDDDAWTVMASAPAGAERRFLLAGSLARAGFSGSEYWDGLPTLYEIDGTGKRSPVPTDKLQVRIRGTPQWRPWGSTIGDLEIRVREGSETVFRSRLTSLPARTKIAIDAHEANVAIQAEGLEHARLGRGALIEASQGACIVPLPADAMDPTAPLELFLRSGRCTLMVPSPRRAAQFIGRDGPVHRRVVLDRINQIRVRAVSPDPRDRFELEARVRGMTPWLSIGRVPPVRSSIGVWERGLESVEDQLLDLFAHVNDLDVNVEVRLESTNRATGHPSIKVRRYEARPIARWITDDELEITLELEAAECLGASGLALLEMQMRPLDEPDQPSRPIVRVSEERWRVSSAELATARNWLVTGSIRQRVRLRPLLICSRSCNPTDAAGTELNRLMSESHVQTRRDGLVKLLEQMSSQWSRREWDQLARFLDTLGALPATTFDVVETLSHMPAVAAAALFRCGGNEAAVHKIWKGMEQLPFLWALVPVSAWIAAARALSVWATESCGGDVTQARTIARLFTDVLTPCAARLSCLLGVVQDLFSRVTDLVPVPAAPYLSRTVASVLPGMLIERARELLRRHEDERWPTGIDVLQAAIGDELDGRAARLFSELGTGQHQSVLKIPFLVGLAAGSDRELPGSCLLSIRRIRTFDPAWFDLAHAIGFALAAGPRLERTS